MFLSIIIPIYNAAAHLHEALDSILCQSFKDYELLLIDDGSKDESLQIMQEYAARYLQIRIIDKPNEGVSATRNRGIIEAKGEYLYFMDADDLLHPRFLELMVSETKRTNADIMVCDYTTFYTRPKYQKLPEGIKSESISGGLQAFEKLVPQGRATSLWNKFLRNLLQTQNVSILLDSRMTFGEDMFFCWKQLLMAERVFVVNAPLYLYRQSGAGATTRYHDKLYERYRDAFDDVEAFGDSHGIDKGQLHESICHHFARRIPSLVNMEYRAPYTQQQKVSHLLQVLNDKDIREGLYVHKNELTGEYYDAARAKNAAKLLKLARKNFWITRMLNPIKRLLK